MYPPWKKIWSGENVTKDIPYRKQITDNQIRIFRKIQRCGSQNICHNPSAIYITVHHISVTYAEIKKKLLHLSKFFSSLLWIVTTLLLFDASDYQPNSLVLSQYPNHFEQRELVLNRPFWSRWKCRYLEFSNGDWRWSHYFPEKMLQILDFIKSSELRNDDEAKEK